MIQNPIPFIANIVLMAHVKGSLSPSALAQLESVRSELKLKKNDLTAAIKLVSSGNYKMTPVGSFIDQVRNLDFIIRVAYIDNDLDEVETALVNEFAHAAGIYEDQLEKVRQDVMASLKDQGKACVSCGTISDANARFCQKCGTSFDEIINNELPQSELKIPNDGLAIEFAESTAASFPRALELAKANSGFQTCQRNKKSWYMASYPSINSEQVLPLCDALSGIRNRRVYLDGKEAVWDEIFGFNWCAVRQAAAYRPLEYCFGNDDNRINPWGCKHANMEWSEWARWFSYGRWEKSGIFGGKVQFRLDKERIKHELATNLYRYRFCPHLRPELTVAVLKYLPEIIVPEGDKNWSYRRGYEQTPGSIKVIEKNDTFSQEYWSDGVRPIGHFVFVDVLKKALGDTGSSPLWLQNVKK